MTGGTKSAAELDLKKIKLPNEEDRISELPDSIIHHILSFLPSIREAIQTGVLSKRWRNQWTGVPVLTFDLLGMNEQFASRFIFSTLARYDCSKIRKLTIMKEAGNDDFECDESLSRQIFQHLQHVKDLKLGTSFIELLSSLEVRVAQSFPLLNNKCLTLHYARFDKHAAGIAHALHNSHLIEKLVITKFSHMYAAFPVDVGNYWYSNETVFKCLESNLKIVEIMNFSKRVRDYEHVPNFIDFLLKNSRVLEKLAVVFENDKDFEFEVSMKLWCFKKFPQHIIVEFLHSASSLN